MVDLAHHKLFNAKVSKGAIIYITLDQLAVL